MSRRVAIVGVGQTAFRSISPDVSSKEMMYEAAVKAYADAGVDPRRDIDSFVCCAEDFIEGRSISDIHVPDQIGAVLRPVHTIPGDGLYGLGAAYMQIQTGAMEMVAVEAHSKVSNLLTHDHCLAFALDPIYNRPLGYNPYFVAGMEMNRYLYETRNTREQCARVVVENRRKALDNPLACYGARVMVEEVLSSEVMFYPLCRLDMSQPADGGIVMVLASEEKARSLPARPIWVRGVGWCSDAPSLESREWGEAVYIRLAAEMAYRMAGIKEPRREIDLVEVDDTFSYKELQHLEALGLCPRGRAGFLIEEGAMERDGELPVNLSGGSLGFGHLVEASGLARAAEVALQLRGEAGRRQVAGVKRGLAASWRGVPTTSGAVVLLEAD